MRFDAAASMRCWGVAVDLGGVEYHIPPRPAGPWLTALTARSLRPIVPGMVAGLDADDLVDAMVRGRVRVADLDRAARDAITEASGMRWWSAARLAYWLTSNWETLGAEVLGRNVRLDTDPLGLVLVLAYRVIQENAKGEPERRRVDLELDKPPVGLGVAAEEMFDQQTATSAFMALAGGGGD